MAIVYEEAEPTKKTVNYTTRRMGFGAHTMTRAEYMAAMENRGAPLDYVGMAKHNRRFKAAP